MTTDGNAAEAAAGSTANGAGSTGEQPDYKALYEQAQVKLVDAAKTAEEWRSRHTGLQGKYQQEQGKWAKDVDELFKTKDQLQTISGEREALAVKAQTLEQQVQAKVSEAAQAATKANRLTMIAGEFPALLTLEAKGLLPDGEGDTLKAKLTELNAALLGNGQKAIQEFRNGESPKPPSGVVEGTSAAMLKQANEALKAGDQTKYDGLYDKYLALKREGK